MEQRQPRRPYLLRAMHEWISDSGLTPLIVVDANVTGVSVPAQHIEDGKVILNIAETATAGLTIGNSELSFAARFGGIATEVRVPVAAVIGIYSRETGEGTIFSSEESAAGESDGSEESPAPDAGAQKKKPTLTVIK